MSATDTDRLCDALRGHVRALAGEIGERHVFRPAALRAAADYIGAAWQAQGHAVAAQRYTARDIECANLEVTIAGATKGSAEVFRTH